MLFVARKPNYRNVYFVYIFFFNHPPFFSNFLFFFFSKPNMTCHKCNPKYSLPFCVCACLCIFCVWSVRFVLQELQDNVTYCSLSTFQGIRLFSVCMTDVGLLILSALMYNCVPESVVFFRTRSLTKLLLLRLYALVLTMILYTKMARSSLRLNES